jgi:hypothetical protein
MSGDEPKAPDAEPPAKPPKSDDTTVTIAGRYGIRLREGLALRWRLSDAEGRDGR